jgi:hypothetical protein
MIVLVELTQYFRKITVNLAHVVCFYDKGPDGTLVTLSNGCNLDVVETYEEIKEMMEKM